MAVADVEQDRFAFGENWARFLRVLDEDRVAEAERSLAAARLGAASLHSFDFDADSVACTRELRQREGVSEDRWTVERGSALDGAYLRGLGQFDLVYSWGVLHHTGDLWTAFDRAAEAVAAGGVLFIAIYNDQGAR